MSTETTTEAAPDLGRGARLATTLGRAVLVLIVIGSGLVALVAGWHALTGRIPISLGGASPWPTVETLPQILQAESRDGDQLRVIDLPAWIRALAYAPGVLSGASAAGAALFGLRVVRAVRRGTPFTPGSIRALLAAGTVLSLGGALQGLVDTAASAALIHYSGSPTWESMYSGIGVTGGIWPMGQIAVGLGLLALATAFREGARLQNETRGLV